MVLVSVIIPTYNREDTVVRAIESVLDQTHEEIECIIVDDGSKDGTASILESYEDPRIRYIHHKANKGVSAARNTGIEEAQGEYIAFLDSDDKWEDEKIEKQLDYLQSKPNSWKIVYCGAKKERGSLLKEFGSSVFPSNRGSEGGEELISDIISMKLAVRAGSTLLAEKKAMVEAGRLDEALHRHEELEFLARLLEVGRWDMWMRN